MNWPLVKLSQVCRVSTGQNAPQDEEAFTIEGTPFIRAGSLKELILGKSEDEFEKINEENAKRFRLRLFPEDTIIFAKSGMSAKIGLVYRLKRDCYLVSHLAALIPEKDIDVGYLHRWFQKHSPSNLIANEAYPSIKTSEIQKVQIPLPPLKEQNRIADVLDMADKLRRNREKAIALSDDLLRSVFLDMFGDPIENPQKWEVDLLENITTKICNGTTPKGGKKVYVENGILFLRSQNVWRRRLELDDVAYIDHETNDKMKKTSLKNGDILITKTGRINTENSSLGRAAMFEGQDDSANINGHVYLIRPKSEVINDFVLYIMTMPEYRDYIRKVCVGGIDKRQINKEHLEKFPIINPPVEMQSKFIEFLNHIEKGKVDLNEQLQHANDIFYSLTQRAFQGQLTSQEEVA